MPQELTIHLEQGIVEVVASEEVTLEQMNASLRQIDRAAGQQPLRALLYDGRGITRAPAEEELYGFAKRSTKSMNVRRMQFALLTSKDSALPYLHLALPAAQRGQYVKVFSDREAALEWLGNGHTADSCTQQAT
jgi:hypothetical protein